MRLNPLFAYFILLGTFAAANSTAALGIENDIDSIAKRSDLTHVIERPEMEGTYLVRLASGEQLNFNIIQTRRQRIAVGLTSGPFGSPAGFGYYFAAYDTVRDQYIASHRNPATEAERNWWVRFRIPELGQVEGDVFLPGRGFMRFSGSRTQNYENFFRFHQDQKRDVTGEYRGELVCSGQKIQVQLGVMEFPDGSLNGTLATLTVNEASRNAQVNAIIDFQIGNSNTETGVVYLTRSPRRNFTFIHIRGVVDGSGFRGEYIHGGHGRVCDPFVWARIDRN